jgi:protein Mpv17
MHDDALDTLDTHRTAQQQLLKRKKMTFAAARMLFFLGLSCPSVAFSASFHHTSLPVPTKTNPRALTSPLFRSRTSSSLFGLRGGDQSSELKVEEVAVPEGSVPDVTAPDTVAPEVTSPQTTRFSASLLAPMASSLASFGAAYGASLEKRPIATKSITAGAIFALSDWLAQQLDSDPKSTNGKRTISSALVGLLYFGPAAHYWYEMIFKLLPGTSLFSTLQKAALGQLLFGPSFTCIFFATSLMQQGSFSLKNWGNKIKSDLPGAWAAGLGFWPLVDLVSFSMIPKKWIPLFVNACSLVWTIYLSIVANRQAKQS